MAFPATTGEVTDVALELTITEAGTRQGVSVLLRNTGDVTIYLGDENVNTTNAGFPLFPGEAPSINLNTSDSIYLICATGQTGSYALLKQDD